MIRSMQRAFPNYLWKSILGIFALYLFLLTKAVLFKMEPMQSWGLLFSPFYSINFIPLRTIFSFFSNTQSFGILFLNLAANIGLFIPMGILLPVLFQRWEGRNTLTASICTSVIFESIQYFFQIGVADIDDVLLNALGAVIGICIYKFLKRSFQEEHSFLMAAVSATLFVVGVGLFVYIFYSL